MPPDSAEPDRAGDNPRLSPDDVPTRADDRSQSIDADSTRSIESSLERPGVEKTLDFPPARGRAHAPATAGFRDYELLGEIARGGMGVVHKARHKRLNRTVALKMILAGSFASQAEVQRFFAEAESAARLDHPGIVPIYEIGESEGRHFFSMAFVDGASLAARIKDGPLPASTAAELVKSVAEAVHYAHERDIVHRDLKPANILLDSQGRPKVTDFGLAKRLDRADGMTVSGDILGTPNYMAPEQARGQLDAIGPRTDVYALGAVLYATLVGRPPFQAATLPATLRMVCEAHPESPAKARREVPRDLATICLKCLEKEPARRYGSAGELAEDLGRFLRGEAIVAKPEEWSRRAGRVLRRRGAWLAVGAALALLAVVATFAYRELGVARRARAAGQAFASAIDGYDGDPAAADRIDSLATEWERLDKSAGAEARSKIPQAIAAHVRRELGSPRVDEAAAESLAKEIAWIESRHALLAKTLTEELNARRGSWRIESEWSPDKENVEWFAASDVASSSGGASNAKANVPLVRTLHKSQGRSRTTATFAGDWAKSRELGLAMHCRPSEPGETAKAPYEFLALPAITATTESAAEEGGPATRPKSFEESGLRIELQIRREGRTLRSAPVNARPGELRLLAERDGETLRLQFGEATLAFDDLVPLRGDEGSVWGIVLPNEARLTFARFERAASPLAASPLEQADDRMERGEFSEALRLYETAALSNDKWGIEARFKAGLCRRSQGDAAGAAAAWEAAAIAEDSRWSVVAATQLWLLRMRQKDFEKAKEMYALVSLRFDADQLERLVPMDVRAELLGAAETRTAAQAFFARDNLTERDEARLSMAELLRLPDEARLATERLAVLSMFAADYPRAVELNDRILETAPISDHTTWLTRSLAWSLRSMRQPNPAQIRVQRMIDKIDKTPPPDDDYHKALWPRVRASLQLELALCLGDQGEWEAAESAVDRFFADSPRPYSHYAPFARAHLLKGFMQERRGEGTAAIETWKRGLWGEYLAQRPTDPDALRSPIPTGNWGVMDHWILGSLVDLLSDDECQTIWRSIADRAASDPLARQVAAALPMSSDAVRGVWRSTRGRETARRMAFLELPPSEHLLAPARLTLFEKLSRDLFDGAPSPAQDDAIWSFARMASDEFFAHRLTKPQILRLAFAWKGTSGILGWDGVKGSLAPELREPIAYVMGRRYVRLDKPDEAKRMFQTARDAVAEDSPIDQLAGEELAALEKPPGDDSKPNP